MHHHKSSSAPVEFDDVFQTINTFGTYQKLVYFSCSCFMQLMIAFGYGMLVFGFATPPFQCSTFNITCPQDTCCENCTSYSFDKAFTSTATEWNLICDRASLNAAIQTCFYVGMLIGAPISGMVSDAFGRKKCIYIFNGIMIVAGFTSSFSNSVPLMGALWFVFGFGHIGFMMSEYVYIMEIVGPKARTMAGSVSDLCYATGFLISILLAYFIRDWRILIMVASAPGGLLYFFCRIFPESPRWLLAHGYLDEAFFILLKYGGRENKEIDKEKLRNIIADVRRNQIEKQKETKVSDPRMLCQTPKIRKWSATLGFNWFATSFLGNALFLYAANLSGNMYLNFAILNVIGVVQQPILWFILKRFGRRIPHVVVMFLIGTQCLLVLAVPNEYPMVKSGLFLGAGGMAGMLWTTVCILTSETYPTVVRNTAIGTGSMVGRIGAITAPFMAMLGRIPKYGLTVAVVIFGVVSLSAGVISLFIPETLFAPMHQTIEEAEAAKEDYGIPCCGRPGNKSVEVEVVGCQDTKL